MPWTLSLLLLAAPVAAAQDIGDTGLVQVGLGQSMDVAEAFRLYDPTIEYEQRNAGNCMCSSGGLPALTYTTLVDTPLFPTRAEADCEQYCSSWDNCIAWLYLAYHPVGGAPWHPLFHFNRCYLYYHVGTRDTLAAISGPQPFAGWEAAAGADPSKRGRGYFTDEAQYDTACEADHAAAATLDAAKGQVGSGCMFKRASPGPTTPRPRPPASYGALTPAALTPKTSAYAGGDPHPVAAKGDPHLVNVLGQRFDLLQPGNHTMILIPKRARPSHALLSVRALAEKIGGSCEDMYIQKITISGKWAEARHRHQPHGRSIKYFAGHPTPIGKIWTTYGKVGLKVVWGHTNHGVEYLNLLVRRLNHVGHPVGGLLGEDDHTAAKTPSPNCRHSVDI